MLADLFELEQAVAATLAAVVVGDLTVTGVVR
jgi:hypothetical protein